MRQQLTKIALLALISSTIGCDQVSKHLATEHLLGVPRHSFLGDMLRLEYAENAGAFLSLGAGLPAWARVALFCVGNGIILAVCGVVALRHSWPRIPRIGLALLFAGGVSNLVDRIAHGSVVDFMNVGIGTLRTGIFNVADMAVLLGIAMILPLRRSRRDDCSPAA